MFPTSGRPATSQVQFSRSDLSASATSQSEDQIEPCHPGNREPSAPPAGGTVAASPVDPAAPDHAVPGHWGNWGWGGTMDSREQGQTASQIRPILDPINGCGFLLPETQKAAPGAQNTPDLANTDGWMEACQLLKAKLGGRLDNSVSWKQGNFQQFSAQCPGCLSPKR